MVFFEQELRCFPMIFSLELVLGAMGCWCKSAWLCFKSLGNPQNLTGAKEMFHHVSHFWTYQHGDLGNLCQRLLFISFNMDKNWADRKTAIVVRMQCNQNAMCWCHSSFRLYLQEVWIEFVPSCELQEDLEVCTLQILQIFDISAFWGCSFWAFQTHKVVPTRMARDTPDQTGGHRWTQFSMLLDLADNLEAPRRQNEPRMTISIDSLIHVS